MNRVLVVGAGLMGSSIGLAARESGWDARIVDESLERTARAVAVTGLAQLDEQFSPDIVVVATPPSTTALAVMDALRLYPKSIVIDIASIKTEVINEVDTLGGQNVHYVPTHPMAGRSVSGAANARVDLFLDRRWVICPHSQTSRVVLDLVEKLVTDCGAIPIYMDPAAHDRSVSVTSHLPQVLSTLLASQLRRLTDAEIAVSGPGLRDMTRLASSDSSLWTDIVLSNNRHIYETLISFIDEASKFAEAVRSASAPAIHDTFAIGVVQRDRVPGKHGEVAQDYVVVSVMIDDKPGQLAGIFECAGRADINIEDVRIDHALGRETAIVELSITPENAKSLQNALSAAGWSIREENSAR